MERNFRWSGQEGARRLNESLDVRLLHVRPQECGTVGPALNECDQLWIVEALQNLNARARRLDGQDCGHQVRTDVSASKALPGWAM